MTEQMRNRTSGEMVEIYQVLFDQLKNVVSHQIDKFWVMIPLNSSRTQSRKIKRRSS